jgi:hypothetical protein
MGFSKKEKKKKEQKKGTRKQSVGKKSGAVGEQLLKRFHL